MLRCPVAPRFFGIVHARLVRADVNPRSNGRAAYFTACRSPRGGGRVYFFVVSYRSLARSFVSISFVSVRPPRRLLQRRSAFQRAFASVTRTSRRAFLFLRRKVRLGVSRAPNRRASRRGKSSIINRSPLPAPATRTRFLAGDRDRSHDEKTCTGYIRSTSLANRSVVD